MVKPRWIAALLLALVVAGVFAWLGKWQLGHAIAVDTGDSAVSETARPIAELTAAGAPVTDTAAGMVVEAKGKLVPGDFRVVEQRRHGDDQGAWVTGHFATDDGAHLAVAIAWAPSAEGAERAIADLEADPALVGAELDLTGRYMPADAAAAPKPGEDPDRIVSMAPAQLVNVWAAFDGLAYPGYLVMHPAAPLDDSALQGLGLEVIDSVPPLPVESVNWLNLFYAAEWVVFAGFAVYLWYRLARDDWEKTHELMLLEAEQQGQSIASAPAPAQSEPHAAG